MKKLKVIGGWSFIIAYLVVSLGFIGKKTESVPCREIKIEILDSLQNGFITKKDIQKIINSTHTSILGSPVSTVNTDVIEKAILKNRSIKSCDIFKTADGTLHVEIFQREPVLRIINKNLENYYISQEGYLIPFSSIQTPNVLIANGYITENLTLNLKKHDHVNKFNLKGKENLLADLQGLASFIHNDPFWNSQFVQLYVNKKQEIELIPRVGAHIIILGKAAGYEEKLIKLKTLYVKGLNNVGWNEYETINLKYKNQVICSKR